MAYRDTRQSKKDFVRWHRSTSQDDDKILRIFNTNGGYYAVFGKQNAEYIANDINGITAFVQQFPPKVKEKKDEKKKQQITPDDENDTIAVIYFKTNHKCKIIQHYVSQLSKTVEIYIRNQTGKWTVSDRISPSNYSTGSIGEAAFNFISIILQFKNQERRIGICLYNHANYKLEISQFIEDDRFTKISSLFAAKGVKQCIFKCISNIKQRHEMEIYKFHQILKKNNIQLLKPEFEKFWSFTNKDPLIMSNINTIINKTSKKRLLTFNNDDYKLAYGATCGVILHQELHKNENLGHFKLIEHKIESFMRLDNKALNALDLFPTPDNINSTTNSLYAILNKTSSPMGARLLSTWIRQPLRDVKQIHRRQKLVKLFVENSQVRCTLRQEHMKKLVDLEKISAKLINNKADLKTLVDLYDFVSVIPFINEELKQMVDVTFMNDEYKPLKVLHNEFTVPIQDIETNFNNYLAMIELIVDLDGVVKNREYLINKTFDKLLETLAKEKDTIWRDIEKNIKFAATDLDFDDNAVSICKLTTKGIQPANKYCLRVKKDRKNKGKIENDSHYTLIPTNKKCIYFTTKKLKILSKKCVDAENKYIKRQNSIVSKTVEITSSYINVIDESAKIFCELDVILALAHVAATSCNKYVLPKVYNSCTDYCVDEKCEQKDSEHKFLKMKNARHPCLELIQLEDMGGVVANNAELIHGKSSFQIVTGPNMGGKSTYIRMIGLVALMAQIGSYVPCDECSLTVFDAILARVGASDQSMRGISTFMGEMLESSSILEGATKNSLIIVDELGRGTSTYDGYGIAYAISEYIIKDINSFCLFATHFHELSALATEFECVVNKHVTAIVNDDIKSNIAKSSSRKPIMNKGMDNCVKLKMTYKIKKGPCPQSFGIEVAEVAQFPKNVIKMANNKVIELESKKNSTVTLLTYQSLKQIMELYKNIARKVKMNNLKETDKMYEDEIEKLEEFIHSKIDNNDDGNEELDDLCIEIWKEVENNDCDKMEID